MVTYLPLYLDASILMNEVADNASNLHAVGMHHYNLDAMIIVDHTNHLMYTQHYFITASDVNLSKFRRRSN